jgi:multidrug efflux system membrane fusion protein
MERSWPAASKENVSGIEAAQNTKMEFAASKGYAQTSFILKSHLNRLMVSHSLPASGARPSSPYRTISHVVISSAIGVMFLFTGCGEKAKNPRGGSGAAAPVHAGKVEKKIVPLTLDAIGAVEPSRTVSIRSQVTGTLMKIDFEEGQDVQPGELLFEIDPRPFQNSLRSAEAELARNRVQIENTRAQTARYRALNAESAISKEQFQTIEDAERTAAAQVLSGEAAVANARLQLEYCSIRAPIAGRTGAFGAHEGDLVSSNSASPLVVLNQLSPTYVSFGVPQQYLADLSKYRASAPLSVSAVPPGSDTTPEKGQLTFIDNAVDSTTGTVRLKATFPNESHRLWPGQFVTARLTLAAPEVIAVTSSAIQSDQSGQHVFVIKADKTAEFRPVVVERTSGSDTVISKGLTEGETVVTDGQLRVVPGRPVDVKPATPANIAAPAAAAAATSKKSAP